MSEHVPAGPTSAERAWTGLLRAHATARRLLTVRLDAEHGLTVNDYEALVLLARADGRRLKRVELAERLLLTPSGVTRMLEGLEAAGLVRRAACPGDLRVVYAELTDDGAELLRIASGGHDRSVRAFFRGALDADELEELARLLERLPGVTDGAPACALDGWSVPGSNR